MGKLIDGKALALEMRQKLRAKVANLKADKGIVPGLVVILVGENPASQVYVKNKEKAALEVGFKSKTVLLPETISQEALLEQIAYYNANSEFHGILVQLPLPKHLNEQEILQAIRSDKDIDGFHPTNMGHLWSGHPIMVPCTPAGIIELLMAYQVNLEGKEAVVIGRSNIVGKPIAQLLLEKNATVTLTHSRTHHLAEIARKADILVVAIGKANFVTSEFVKEGAVVIDVGINRDDSGKLCGDVVFEQVAPKASLITPVPGGVGPMTIAMLLEQTYQSALRHISKAN